MTFPLLARIVRISLVAVLVLGPALAFAAPMAAGMQDASGKTGTVVSIGHASESGCAGCPTDSKGNGMAVAGCDATCPSFVALPAVLAAVERQGVVIWTAQSVPQDLGVPRQVDPHPPKASSRA
ncbi:MAG: hypothetical protein HYR63_03770 [Proteobacteria bacterium]|nr:hypothetical protein [Pseudomonadota bacterium]